MTKKINYFDYGYVRCSAVSPKLYLAKPMKNAEKVIEIAKQESEKESLIVLFPELGLTGYTCQDLFHSSDLLEENRKAIKYVLEKSVNINSFIVVGHPYQSYDGRLYNCTSIIYKGKILAMSPKTHLPNQMEFYEKRHFISGYGVDLVINDFGQTFRLCSQQVVNFKNQVIMGIECCEDAFAPQNVGIGLAVNGGCNLLLNPSASNELIAKHDYRKSLLAQHSARLNLAYLYASAGPWESSTDILFSGSVLGYENGSLLAEGERFSFEDQVTTVEFDFNKLAMERRRNTTFGSSPKTEHVHVVNVDSEIDYSLNSLKRTYAKNPFVPTDLTTLIERSEEIIRIQSTALARRMLAIGKPKLLLGLSGGLDSTLAMLVCLEAVKKVNQPITDIICISMPGFGTSNRTKSQSQRLAACSGVTFKEIDITESVKHHFKDIGHDENNFNVVYENAQARERMQILFDVSNQQATSGIVVNSSNLSECVIGWSTYSADQTGNYAINASVPKTLVQHLIGYYKENRTTDPSFKQVLQDVLDTKISPELLPLDKDGNIEQDSQSSVGPYILVDFFTYHYLRNFFSPNKILEIATLTFKEDYSKEVLKKWLDLFFKRFKKNQFKRTSFPPGVKVGVSVSPRGDLRMSCDLPLDD